MYFAVSAFKQLLFILIRPSIRQNLASQARHYMDAPVRETASRSVVSTPEQLDHRILADRPRLPRSLL